MILLVLEFQLRHHLSDGRLGLLLSLLAIAAIATMLLCAPASSAWPPASGAARTSPSRSSP